MTRAWKTMSPSVKDFDRLIGGESIDTGISHVIPSPQLVKPTVFSQTSTSTSPKTRKASSSLHHRLFSRSSATPGQPEEENDPSESTPGPHDVTSETTSPTPRKTIMMMTGWRFSRLAPRKNSRPTENTEDIAAATSTSRSPNAEDPGSGIQASSHSFPYYSVTSYAPTSTSSLGSLVPTHERLFHVASRDPTDEHTSTCLQHSDSLRVHAPPPRSSRAAITTPSDSISPDGDNSGSGARDNRRMVERYLHQDQASRMTTQASSFELATEEETYLRRSIAANTEPEMSDEDPTPRIDPLVAMPTTTATTQMRGRRVQCLNIDVLALRPAIGVTPHAPSETESFCTSACSASVSSPPTSPITRDSFTAAFPAMKPSSDTDAGTFSPPPRVLPSITPPSPRVVAVSPPGSLRSNSNCSRDGVTMASAASIVASPRSRKRAISRSLTPPPCPRPPPKGPLPAVPSSPVPPVPPLPPLFNKFSMNVKASPHAMTPSLPRSSVITGAATTPANAGTAALPPSPPGALRLPSRLSWINSVRAALPSPPASPTKKAKTLGGGDKPSSLSQPEKKPPGELEQRWRPTSVGVIQATEDLNGDNEVRRTKSILLLGSRSKSNMSLGTKRVQIHADVNGDSDVGGDSVGVGAPSPATATEVSVLAPAPASTSLRKQKRTNSAAAALGLGLGRPIAFSSPGPYPRVPSLPVPMPTTNSRREEVVVFPLERRHSAPLFSTFDLKRSADWTLSLPFSTDVPGNKILLSSSSEPQLKSPEKEEEDWTLCMPLKLRAIDVPVHKSSDGDGEEGVSVDTSETVTTEEEEDRTTMQLPTPSPSPTFPTLRLDVVQLDPVEDKEQQNEDEEEEAEEETEERRSMSVIEPEDRPASPASTLGPHVGGLDLAGGCGKRASGWHLYGWFDEVEDITSPVVAAVSEGRFIKSHVSAFRNNDSSSGPRHPSQDSIVSSAASTLNTVFYSARSSWLDN